MRSAFFPFHIATTGLHAARANLNTVSHNMSNAEIPGFSRQQTVQSASRPLHLWDGRGMYGTGAQTNAIIQHRNQFLDVRFRHQTSIMGDHATKATHLSSMETVFNNLNDAGILSAFNNFFSPMHDLRGNAPDDTFRTNVITGAEALAETARHNALALQRQQIDLNREVADVVMMINSLGSQITSLNRQIADFERDGSNANDLRDRRNLLLDELSQFVNIEVNERDFSTPTRPNDRRLTVQINGSDFVRHDQFFSLELVPRQAAQRRNEMDVDGLYDITFAGGAGAFDIYNHNLRGALRGLIDLRDGNNSVPTVDLVAIWPSGFLTHAPQQWDRWYFYNPTTGLREPATTESQINAAINAFNPYDPTTWPRGARTDIYGHVTSNYKGIPFYMNQLNSLVRTFARGINEGLDAQFRQIPGATGHIHGFDINGDHRSALFFTYTRADTATQATWQDASNPRLRLFHDGNGGYTTTDTGNPVYDDRDLPVFVMDLSGMNALNFVVNQELTHNHSLLATSSHPDQGESNNQVILGFSLIGSYPHLFREGRLEDFIIAISDHLAIDLEQALNFTLSFAEITTHTHNQRLSVKGVDINEEMMDLVRFQHMFQAASRLINVIDSIYDTLINRLGAF